MRSVQTFDWWCIRWWPTFLAHAYGMAFMEAAGLALAPVFLGYTAFIQERAGKWWCPLYGTSRMSQKYSKHSPVRRNVQR